MEANNKAMLVYVTVPASQDAVELAGMLVGKHLAAGINILGPGQSVYFWEGEIHKNREWIMFAQVHAAALEDFKEAVLRIHPYKVPCVIAMPIEFGHAPFMEWIAANSRRSGE